MNNNGHAHSTHAKTYRHPALAAGASGETTLRRSLRILRRRQWVFLIIAGGIFTLGFIIATGRPMTYRSEASVEVGPETPISPTMLLGERVTRSMPPWDHHFKTQEALLRREGLLKQVLESLPPGIVSAYAGSPDPVRKLARHISVDDIPDTFVIKVGLDHDTAAGGPDIVNRLIELYIEDSNKRLHNQILGVMEDLERKTMPEIKKGVDDAEQKLSEFIVKNGLGVGDHHSSLVERRRMLQSRIFEMRMRQMDLRLDPTGRALPPDEDDPTRSLASPRIIDALIVERGRLEMEIAKQSGVLLEKHPEMIGLRNQLKSVKERLEEALGIAKKSRDEALKTAADRLKDALDGSDEALGGLKQEDEELNKEIAAASAQMAQQVRLEEEARTARTIYNTYLTKLAEVKAMAGAGVSSVRVVDKATTPLGSRKDTRLILALGAVLGLLFGAVGVVIAEQNDDRASTPYEAETAIGLDVLVAIPRLSKPLGSRAPVVPKDNPLKSPLEPFRRLRLEVAARLHSIEGSRVVSVVGDGYSEGKSTVAINLARVLGLENRKVLLVDGEFRRPKLKALLADVNKPGLEEYLRSDARFTDAVQNTSMQNVDVLGASKPMVEAPEMPAMERIRDLWEKARSSYDYVIVDAGPVNYHSEVAGLALHSDAAIIVMDERRTKLRNVVSTRRVLENLGIKILGLIVNRSANPEAGGLVSRMILEAQAKTNGHAEVHAAAAVPVAMPTVMMAPAHPPGEDPTLKAVLDRLFLEMDSTKQRAMTVEGERATLAAREEQLRKAIEETEREYNRKLEGELRKNAEIGEKMAAFVETSRLHDEEQLKKLEVIFTKSLEGVNKKLTDLRLRAIAGGGMGGGGGMEGDVQLRPSQATIDGIFNQKIESNLGGMDKPEAKKATGGVNNALDRLKNMRTNATPKKDEEKK